LTFRRNPTFRPSNVVSVPLRAALSMQASKARRLEVTTRWTASGESADAASGS
jgi:hypothetical protein